MDARLHDSHFTCRNPGLTMIVVNLVPEVGCAIFNDGVGRDKDRVVGRIPNIVHRSVCCGPPGNWGFLAMGSCQDNNRSLPFKGRVRRYSKPCKFRIGKQTGGWIMRMVFLTIPDFVHRVTSTGRVFDFCQVIVTHSRLDIVGHIGYIGSIALLRNQTRGGTGTDIQVKEIVISWCLGAILAKGALVGSRMQGDDVDVQPTGAIRYPLLMNQPQTVIPKPVRAWINM